MHYIIVNETHLTGKGIKKLDDVKRVFENAGIEYRILTTQKKGDATKHTKYVTSLPGENVVVAMGGDGTLHDIINGFENFETCSLGLIPFGTGNDFAEGAGIPLDVRRAAEIIAKNKPRLIDFIELSSGLRSINSVGMGIDVEVLKRTYASKDSGKGKYLTALLSALKNFQSVHFTVKYDGKVETHYGLIAAVGNGKLLGGGIKLFPNAEIDDGYLDLLIVDYISKRKIPGALLKLKSGKVDKVEAVTFVKTKAVTFIHENPEFTIQAEGELYDNVPLDAHIVEGKLKFYLP